MERNTIASQLFRIKKQESSTKGLYSLVNFKQCP